MLSGSINSYNFQEYSSQNFVLNEEQWDFVFFINRHPPSGLPFDGKFA
jgi:hypothetical protein